MTERAVFESRLRTALRRHVADGPTDFDALAFARAVAAKEPRRRGLVGALGWRWLAIPRRAWVLLLLAGLLAAMVGGMLIAGSQPQRKLPALVPVAACPPGSTPDEPGPVDQARPSVGDGLAAMVFDRQAGRVVLLLQSESVETWTFDVCTNTWTRMHPDREPALSDPTHVIYDVDSDVTIANDGQSLWVYDLTENTWTRKGVTPVVRQWNVLTWTYDPVSGLVIAADLSELWSYDVETDAWALISQVPWRAGLGELAYNASVDQIVAYARPEMWLFDIRTGTWAKSAREAPDVVCAMGWPNPGLIYDEAAERTVVSCNATTGFADYVGTAAAFAYDATADRWESVGVAGRSFPCSVYDARNKRLVGLGENKDGLVALDLTTRELTVLFEPTPTHPGASSE